MIRRARFGLVIGMVLLLTQLGNAAFINIGNGDITALKNAINAANSNGQDDTIQLAANGSYMLNAADNGVNGLPQIGADGGHKLSILGNGSTIQRSEVTGTPNFRIFYINSLSNVSISDLTITNGGSGMNGAAIYINGETGNATVTLLRTALVDNYGYYGGAIYNDGYGGSATLIVTNCTFDQNLSDNNGGAIFNDGSFGGNATFTITGSTFKLNFTDANGGGAIQHYSFGGTVTGNITSSTFHANYAPGNGASINVDGSGSAALNITNCTFNQNTADGFGSVYNASSNAIHLANNIFKSDGVTTNLVNVGGGTMTSLGHNISDDSGSGVLNGTGDRTSTNPMLDSSGLRTNGGPTQTIALLPASPAINSGGDANAPTRDQRSYARSGVSDIGAFEFNGTLAPVSAGSVKTHGASGPFTVDLPLTGGAGVECRTGGTTNDFTMVVTFASNVTVMGSPQAQVTTGTGTVGSGGVSNGGLVNVSGNIVTVPLTNVTNAQQINVMLVNVSDGTNTTSANIPMRILLGDTSGNSNVNASDVLQVKQQVGQSLTASNFRRDINANGIINASDVTTVKLKVGFGIP